MQSFESSLFLTPSSYEYIPINCHKLVVTKSSEIVITENYCKAVFLLFAVSDCNVNV